MGGYYDDEGNWIPDDGGDIITDPGNGTDEGDMITDPNFTGDQDYFDNGDGTWTGADGLIYDDQLNWIGIDYGDGTWSNLSGEVFDANGNSLGFLDFGDLNTGGGFWDGVSNFFSSLFGGKSSGGTTGGGGGGFGGTAGQRQAQQRAQQLSQQLAQARAAGATQAQIAALQRQYAIAAAAAGGSGGLDMKTILIAAGVGLGVYALVSSRRNQ